MHKMQQVLRWEFTMIETGLYYDIPLQGDYCLDFNEDKICDVDFHDGKVVVYGPDVVTKQTSINAMAQLDERQKELIREVNNNDDDNNNNDNDNDNDDNDNDSNSDLDDDSNDNGDDCQSQDDFCDNDEGCESEGVDCIDDRGFDEDDYNG